MVIDTKRFQKDFRKERKIMKTLLSYTNTIKNNAPTHMNDYGFDFVCLEEKSPGDLNKERNW